MTIPISLFCLTIGFFVFSLRAINLHKESVITDLARQQQEIRFKYESVVKQKKALHTEHEKKARQLSRLKNSQDGVSVISCEDLNLEEIDDDQKASQYLLGQGKITLEQNERAFQKMGVLKMDYLGVCLALGFIDMETSQRALKINKARNSSAL
ncbi:hypothetical protein GO013_11435 [Pseudodesulfovibrio sp. JC047]|uniref:hypothetical protein n=1 Tax=Pseudodesulfovibrio sp. JC047 TaxID=2683199 RepID=UPI0013D6F365|nr:hypothetical protein [Pseudodesulfovibrio sp. JC047]NDV20034.1 hypothetical protein [Pseudodesulfovibrio sp. JC047]